MALNKPDNSLVTTVSGQSPAKSRNIIIEQALKHNCTHVFFMDDDMVIEKDSLIKLLAHDKDVVSGLYLMRGYPHFPVAFDEAFDSGKCKFMYLEPGKQGLVPIVNCGLGCVLIKTEVFRKLSKPWVTLGEIEKDGWCDDVAFFNKVRKAGFEMYCDMDVRAGHLVSFALWPAYTNGVWYSQYKHESGNVMVPQTIPTANINRAITIDGWMTETELSFLAEVAQRAELTVEIGSYKGRSTRAICDNAKGKVIAIDPWETDLVDAGDNFIKKVDDIIFDEFKKNLNDHIATEKLSIERMKFFDFEPNGHSPDFIFIDGGHNYEEVVHDIVKSMQMIAKNSIIAGHDYSDAWPGVIKAVDELMGQVNVVDSIWWKQLGE